MSITRFNKRFVICKKTSFSTNSEDLLLFNANNQAKTLDQLLLIAVCPLLIF